MKNTKTLIYNDKQSDGTKIGKIGEKKIIEDKELKKLQNLSTEIEKINRKEHNDLE